MADQISSAPQPELTGMANYPWDSLLEDKGQMREDDAQEELTEVEYVAHWRAHVEAVFVDRDIDKMPFRNQEWARVCVGAPAYTFDKVSSVVSPELENHRRLYSALEQAIVEMGDVEIVGSLRNGPYQNPSIFRGVPPLARAMYQMRFRAVDGFDLDICGRSESWGVVISWEEEIALVGGNSRFCAVFEKHVGGREALRDNFEWATAYLHSIGPSQRDLVDRLRSSCFPD